MAACSNGNPLADAITGFFSFLGDPVGTVIGLIAKTILAAAIAVFAGLADSVPTLEDTTTSHDLSNKTSWIVVYLAVGSLLFAAGKMAIERRGTAGVTALKGIMRVVLVSGAATTICLAAARIADSYSTYLFNDSVQSALDNIGACGDNSDIQSFLLLILAFLLLLAGILHTILMYIRLGVMMIMLGTLPMAAAASMTDWGAGWWRKHIGWMISWLLYKPAVALVLNAGMTMITQGKTSTNANVNTRIAGIGVMLLSAIALPALLKLVVPAAAAMGTGNPMASMGQAGGQLASGAVQVGAMSGGSGGGGGGQKGPSGSERHRGCQRLVRCGWLVRGRRFVRFQWLGRRRRLGGLERFVRLGRSERGRQGRRRRGQGSRSGAGRSRRHRGPRGRGRGPDRRLDRLRRRRGRRRRTRQQQVSPGSARHPGRTPPVPPAGVASPDERPPGALPPGRPAVFPTGLDPPHAVLASLHERKPVTCPRKPSPIRPTGTGAGRGARGSGRSASSAPS